MPVPAIAIRQLTKRYQDLLAVDDLSLEVPEGEFFGFLGPNGAGKTTTINAVVGLARFQQGTIRVFGRDAVTEYRAARRLIGLAPQEYNFDRYLTIREALIYQAGYYGLPPSAVAGRADALLKQFDLYGKRDVNYIKLSGGMKRRLTLARALVNDPDLIFMDEPTTGLDPQARHMIWERLKTLLAQGKTIFLTTHFMDEAERLCDRLAVIDHGKLIAEGSPRELMAQHIEPEVVEVYGDNARCWGENQGRQQAARIETSGETVFCYTCAAQPLLASLRDVAGVRYIHRPANLEDVFLKLTGREMRD